MSRSDSSKESIKVLEHISSEESKPSWASTGGGYPPEDGDEFAHLIDDIDDEEL